MGTGTSYLEKVMKDVTNISITSIQVQKRYSTNVAPEFSKTCVDIRSARAEHLESEKETVLVKVTVKPDKIEHEKEL